MDEVAAVGEIEPLRSLVLESGRSASMDSERGSPTERHGEEGELEVKVSHGLKVSRGPIQIAVNGIANERKKSVHSQ